MKTNMKPGSQDTMSTRSECRWTSSTFSSLSPSFFSPLSLKRGDIWLTWTTPKVQTQLPPLLLLLKSMKLSLREKRDRSSKRTRNERRNGKENSPFKFTFWLSSFLPNETCLQYTLISVLSFLLVPLVSDLSSAAGRRIKEVKRRTRYVQIPGWQGKYDMSLFLPLSPQFVIHSSLSFLPFLMDSLLKF